MTNNQEEPFTMLEHPFQWLIDMSYSFVWWTGLFALIGIATIALAFVCGWLK